MIQGMKKRAAALVTRGLAAIGSFHAALAASAFAVAKPRPTPETWFGHRIGADRQLLDWERVVSYFKALASSSDKIRVTEYGRSAENRPLIVAMIAARESELLRRLRTPHANDAQRRKLPETQSAQPARWIFPSFQPQIAAITRRPKVWRLSRIVKTNSRGARRSSTLSRSGWHFDENGAVERVEPSNPSAAIPKIPSDMLSYRFEWFVRAGS